MGYEMDEIIGADIYNFVDPEFHEIHKKKVSEALKTGEIQKLELKAPGPDRSIAWYETIIAPIKENVSIDSFLIIGRDITERKQAETERLQLISIMENTSDLVSISTPDRHIKYINQAGANMVGWRIDNEFLTRKEVSDVHPKWAADIINNEAIPSAIQNGIWRGETAILGRDGCEVPCSQVVMAHKSPNGELEYISTIIRDISESKKAEAELIRVKKAIEGASDAIGMSDPKGHHFYQNQSFNELFGYKKAEELEFKGGGSAAYADQEVAREVFNNIMSGKSWIGEVEMLSKGGRKFPVFLRADAIKDEKNNIIGLIGIHTDITERKQAEEALRESEEKFRTLAEHSLVGLAILQDDEIKYINKKMADIIEYPYEEIKNWTSFDFLNIVHPDQTKFLEEQAKKKQNGLSEIIEEYEICISTKEGKEKYLYNLSKTISYEGKPADFICQIDITDRKKIEKELINSEKKYRKAYDRAEFYKDLFAHDVNNIFQVILSSTELCQLKGGFNNVEINELYQIVNEQIHRGINLIHNIQKMPAIDKSIATVYKSNLSEVLKKAISLLKVSFQNRNLKIDYDGTQNNYIVKANDLLLEVFENLLMNSVIHNENKNIEISIKTSRETRDNVNYIRIDFIDNGFGIEDNRKEKIFLRASGETKSSHGMGLGLTLVYKIIKRINGHIWVEDKVKGNFSKGSKFVILLPEWV